MAAPGEGQDVLSEGAADPLGRALERVATLLSLFGGLVLFALTILTVISVVGRSLVAQPVPGDFEIIELGMAVAIFSFLPHCQMTGGNVIVDLFTAKASTRVRAVLDTIANLIFTIIAAILTWRTALGGHDVYRYNETSMVLRIPVWWGYVPATLFLGFLTVVCAYTTWRSAKAAQEAGPS